MRLYSNLKAIPLSLFSKELYQDVAHRWQGMGFSYLFLLISLMSVPFTLFAMTWTFTLTLDSPYDFNYLIDQIPEIRIQQGEVSVSVPEPYFIKTHDNETIGVIDTTRPVVDWPKEFPKNPLLLVVGKHEFMVSNQKKSEKRLYDIPKDNSMTLTRDTVRTMAEKLLGYAWLVPLFSVPFIVPFFFVYALLVMFVYGAVGLGFNLLLRTGYNYSDCLRLACVSSTAGMLVSSLALGFGIAISGWAGFSIDMMYLLFAMWAAKQ